MAWCDHDQPRSQCERCSGVRIAAERERSLREADRRIAENALLRREKEEQAKARLLEIEQQVRVYPPIVFHTTGIGTKFHKVKDCPNLLRGWDRVEEPTELIPDSPRSALQKGYSHCRRCLPRSRYPY